MIIKIKYNINTGKNKDGFRNFKRDYNNLISTNLELGFLNSFLAERRKHKVFFCRFCVLIIQMSVQYAATRSL